jgi:hypothetical protein
MINDSWLHFFISVNPSFIYFKVAPQKKKQIDIVIKRKHKKDYNRLPRRPPFLLVLSEGIGVTSSKIQFSQKCSKTIVIINLPIRPIFIPERAKALRAD